MGQVFLAVMKKDAPCERNCIAKGRGKMGGETIINVSYARITYVILGQVNCQISSTG